MLISNVQLAKLIVNESNLAFRGLGAGICFVKSYGTTGEMQGVGVTGRGWVGHWGYCHLKG